MHKLIYMAIHVYRYGKSHNNYYLVKCQDSGFCGHCTPFWPQSGPIAAHKDTFDQESVNQKIYMLKTSA